MLLKKRDSASYCWYRYAAMVNSSVAIEVEEEVMVRLDGAITSSEEENAGKKQNIYLLAPKS